MWDIMHQTAVLLFSFQNVNICQQHQLRNSNTESVQGNCSFIAEVSLIAGANRFFSCPQHPDWLQGPPTLLSKWYNALSPEVKWWGCKSDHSPPYLAEVKNGGAKPPLPHMPSWHSA
jgi:hypothetical protein